MSMNQSTTPVPRVSVRETPSFTPLEQQLVEALFDSGLSVDFIASAAKRSRADVKALVIQLQGRDSLPVLDEQMASEVRSLASMCLREAKLMLEFGHPDTKLAIMKSMLPALSRHVAQPGDDLDGIRDELEGMMNEMRDVPELETVVTETDIIEVTASE